MRKAAQSGVEGESYGEAEAVHGRGDHRHAAGGGGRPGRGRERRCDGAQVGVSEQTRYRWRPEYGGLRIDQARRFKELERENARLKRLVAEQALDNSILREVAQGNF